jgi:hypothetical protein
VDRVHDESLWLVCPGFADEFVGCQALQGLQATGEVVGGDEVREVTSGLVMAFVVVTLDGGLLEGPVHAFDLSVGPRVARLGQTVIDVVLGTRILEGVRAEEFTAVHGGPDIGGGRADVSGCGEVGAVVGQDGVDLVGHRLDEGVEEVAGNLPGGFLMQLGESELRGPVDGDEKVELALLGADLGDVDVEIAERIVLELLLVGLVAGDVGQARDAVPLEAAVQRRARQMRNGRLQGIQAVVEWQQRVSTKSHDDGLVLERKHSRLCLFRPRRLVRDRGSLPPLGDRLLVDAVAPSKNPQARLTMLYRSTDRRSRCGAAVKNLAHNASFHPPDKNAPSKPGTKHLGPVLESQYSSRCSLSLSCCRFDGHEAKADAAQPKTATRTPPRHGHGTVRRRAHSRPAPAWIYAATPRAS